MVVEEHDDEGGADNSHQATIASYASCPVPAVPPHESPTTSTWICTSGPRLVLP